MHPLRTNKYRVGWKSISTLPCIVHHNSHLQAHTKDLQGQIMPCDLDLRNIQLREAQIIVQLSLTFLQAPYY